MPVIISHFRSSAQPARTEAMLLEIASPTSLKMVYIQLKGIEWDMIWKREQRNTIWKIQQLTSDTKAKLQVIVSGVLLLQAI